MFASITDQCYRNVSLAVRPLRIVSLVPSQTELLIDLGLEELLVGVTRFCVHPTGLTDQVNVMGGTKKIVSSRLYEAQPDLIICNKEENTSEMVSLCDSIAPTYVSDIQDLNDAYQMILDLGILTGASFKAKSIVRQIKMGFNKLPIQQQKEKALYLIWKNPYMSIGSDTFIHDMLNRAGYDNVMQGTTRYPELSAGDIIAAVPDVIFCSSEPYPFVDEDMKELEQAFLSANAKTPRIIKVDGEMFSWYGSRLLHAPEYFLNLRNKK